MNLRCANCATINNDWILSTARQRSCKQMKTIHFFNDMMRKCWSARNQFWWKLNNLLCVRNSVFHRIRRMCLCAVYCTDLPSNPISPNRPSFIHNNENREATACSLTVCVSSCWQYTEWREDDKQTKKESTDCQRKFMTHKSTLQIFCREDFFSSTCKGKLWPEKENLLMIPPARDFESHIQKNLICQIKPFNRIIN